MKNKKMEIMLEQAKKEVDIEKKIQELKDMIEPIKQENDDYKRKMEIERKDYREEIVANNKKIKPFEERIAFYESFNKNKEAIANIKEYQEFLNKRLQELKVKRQEIINSKEQVNEEPAEEVVMKLREEQEGIKKDYEEIQNSRNAIAIKLKENNLTPEERAKLNSEDKIYASLMDENNKRYLDLTKEVKDFRNKSYKTIDEINTMKEEYDNELVSINSQIKDTEIQISKCNLVYSCLLKGKNWDNIEVSLSKQNQKFTAEKGTIEKIEELHNTQENASLDYEKSNQKVELEEEQTVAEPEKEESMYLANTFETKHPILNRIPLLGNLLKRTSRFVDQVKDYVKKGIESKESKENNETKDNNFIDRFEKAVDKKLNATEDKVEDKIEIKNGNKANKMNFNDRLYNYYDKKMKENELETLKNIAEKGYKQQYKETLEDKKKLKNRGLEHIVLENGDEYVKKGMETHNNSNSKEEKNNERVNQDNEYMR